MKVSHTQKTTASKDSSSLTHAMVAAYFTDHNATIIFNEEWRSITKGSGRHVLVSDDTISGDARATKATLATAVPQSLKATPLIPASNWR